MAGRAATVETERPGHASARRRRVVDRASARIVGSMSTTPKILAFAGSAREGSFNKQLVRIAAEGARRAGAEVTLLDLRDLPMPLFDQDLEAREGEHPNARAFKDLLQRHEGLLIASPEHNGSYSALLKNALDWASRRRADEPPLACLTGKLVALMSASPGPLGGARGLPQLATLLRVLRCLVLPDQVTIPGAGQAFDEQGGLKDAHRQESVLQLGALLAGKLSLSR